MPQTKIQGKFYPLKSSEWLDGINQLTHSELQILYYDKDKMHRSTVGRALKELERKELLPDIEAACLTFDVNVTAEEVEQ